MSEAQAEIYANSIIAQGRNSLVVALAGQQNAGKSTIFNALTGMHQHIANYPGVTVDKKSGYYRDQGISIEVVDLPGTYSLTSFSLEERVTREFLMGQVPDVVVNVLDVTNLQRSLHLTIQLLEMGLPVVCVLNMMDVAGRHGIAVDCAAFAKRLNVPIVTSVGRKGVGIKDLKSAILRIGAKDYTPYTPMTYGALETEIASLQAEIDAEPELSKNVIPRWLSMKLLEGDEVGVSLVSKHLNASHPLLGKAENARKEFEQQHELSPADTVISCRDLFVRDILSTCTSHTKTGGIHLTERFDKFLLNRWLAPMFLVLTVWLIYELSIVQGYELTKVTWPYIAGVRNWIADMLPSAGFLHDPQLRSMPLWLVDSANTLLNYVPIFLILFALIAILEDTGYMARIAFILDRILHRFGLHGQSTLPFILGGVFAGGCAVPGVMATKGIPDQRARIATILTVPFMNCLAKVPLYTLLINIYFAEFKGLVLFYLSTITVIFALLVAKLLSVTVLKNMETAPFVMELPRYHMPTVSGVSRRSFDRTWLYIKKVGTIVLAVAALVYVLLQFPGLTPEREVFYKNQAETAIAKFYKSMEGNSYAPVVSTQENLISLVNVYTSYKAAKLNARGKTASLAVDAQYKEKHPEFYDFLKRSKIKDARAAAKAIKVLVRDRKTIRRKMKDERLLNSFLGQTGKSLESVTQFANFDWKVNVALLSSFAARESSVATLGVLFEQADGEAKTLEERMGTAQMAAGYTAMTALAVMMFFVLYPPCLATTIMVRVQTASYGWMMFSIIFPTILGLAVASLISVIGQALGMSAIGMMSALYFTALGLLLIVGFYKRPFGSTLPVPEYTDLAPPEFVLENQDASIKAARKEVS